jgi:hypothetical protein
MKKNIFKSPVTATFLAAALSLNNPTGHGLAHEAMLRIWFAPEWLKASQQIGQPISFDTFRNHDLAQIWVYNEDADVHLHRIKLLQDSFVSCIPSLDNDDKEQHYNPFDNYACHAAGTRGEKKGKCCSLKL